MDYLASRRNQTSGQHHNGVQQHTDKLKQIIKHTKISAMHAPKPLKFKQMVLHCAKMFFISIINIIVFFKWIIFLMVLSYLFFFCIQHSVTCEIKREPNTTTVCRKCSFVHIQKSPRLAIIYMLIDLFLMYWLVWPMQERLQSLQLILWTTPEVKSLGTLSLRGAKKLAVIKL